MLILTWFLFNIEPNTWEHPFPPQIFELGLWIPGQTVYAQWPVLSGVSPQVLWSRQACSLLACLDSTFCFICNLFHWIIKGESPAESMNSNKHERVGSLLQGWPKSTHMLFKMDFLPFFYWLIVPWTTQKWARLLEDTTSAPFNHGDILLAV